MNREIKKKARKDKKRYTIDALERDGSSKERWAEVKNIRKNFTPNFTRMKTIRGERVKKGKKRKRLLSILLRNNGHNLSPEKVIIDQKSSEKTSELMSETLEMMRLIGLSRS